MKQKPTQEWMNYATTAKAKAKIKQILNEEKRKATTEGRDKLGKLLQKGMIDSYNNEINLLTDYFRLSSDIELFYSIGNDPNLK